MYKLIRFWYYKLGSYHFVTNVHDEQDQKIIFHWSNMFSVNNVYKILLPLNLVTAIFKV